MRNLAFTSTLKIANHNRSYSAENPITSGNFLSVTELRSSPEVINTHTYNGIYYGFFYGNLTALDNNSFLHYKAESLNAGAWCLGIKIRQTTSFTTLDIVEGQHFDTGIPAVNNVYSTAVLPKPDGTCMIAWYFNKKAGFESTSTFFLNKVETPLQSYPVAPPTSRLLPVNVIFTPNTPAGFKLGTLWAGFDQNITRANFDQILANWTGKIPYFLGRFGEHPLGGLPAATYINCAEELVRDKPIEAYYAATGTVDITYDYSPFRVASIPDQIGLDWK